MFNWHFVSEINTSVCFNDRLIFLENIIMILHLHKQLLDVANKIKAPRQE